MSFEMKEYEGFKPETKKPVKKNADNKKQQDNKKPKK